MATKYVITTVTTEPLTEEEKMSILEALGKTDKPMSSAIRKINDKEWDSLFETLNKVPVS